MDYCIDTYGSQLSATDVNRIEALRFRIAKILPHPPDIHHDRDRLFIHHGMLPFGRLVEYNIGLTVYKSLHMLLPDYCSLFNQRDGRITRSSARGDLFRANHVSHNFALNSISRFGITVWDRIPLNIRSISNIAEFKTKLYKHLMQSYANEL